MIDHCRNNYNWNDDDTKDYQPKWIKITKTKDETASASALDANTTEAITTTTTPAPTTPKPVPPSQRKKSKYPCQNAWCYQVINLVFLCLSLF